MDLAHTLPCRAVELSHIRRTALVNQACGVLCRISTGLTTTGVVCIQCDEWQQPGKPTLSLLPTVPPTRLCRRVQTTGCVGFP